MNLKRREAPTSRAGVGEHFSVKGEVVNILDFAGQVVSVAATQLCRCGVKAAIDTP